MPSSLSLYRAAMLPSNNLGNATSETQFKDGRGNLLQLPLPSNNSLANKSFRVRVSGRVATTISTSFQLSVYFGLSSTIASNTLMFPSGFQTVNNATSNFELWLDCQWTADGKLITGWGAGQLANQILGPATLSNTPISADANRDSNTFLQSGGTYGFTCTGQFGNTSAGNSAIIDNFDLESA